MKATVQGRFFVFIFIQNFSWNYFALLTSRKGLVRICKSHIVYSSYLEEQPPFNMNPNLGEIGRGNLSGKI